MFSWVTFGAGAAGAFTAHFVAKFIDRQFTIGAEAEKRKDVDLAAFCDALDGIQKCCVRMWLENPKDLGTKEIELQAIITANLKLLTLINSELFRCDIDHKEDNKKSIKEIIKTASGKDFGDPDRKIDKEIVLAVTEQIVSLKHQIKVHRRTLPRHWLG